MQVEQIQSEKTTPKVQFGKYKSKNESRKIQIGKIQLGKIRIEKYKSKLQFWKYSS